MQYQYFAITDIGIKRQKNQDSMVSMEAMTDKGPVYLAAVCDGMGGLDQGEVASSIMAEELEEWFQNSLPSVIYVESAKDSFSDRLVSSLLKTIKTADSKIYEFSQKGNLRCGTTMTALLLYNGNYYIMNVGDSRVYLYRKHLTQLTKDQTKAQQMVDRGEMTETDAENSSESSVLLQCVGMNREIVPECKSNLLLNGDLFILCSDGFRHKITKEEIEKAIREDKPKTRIQLRDFIGYLIDECKRRRETDNISAIAVRVSNE